MLSSIVWLETLEASELASMFYFTVFVSICLANAELLVAKAKHIVLCSRSRMYAVLLSLRSSHSRFLWLPFTRHNLCEWKTWV